MAGSKTAFDPVQCEKTSPFKCTSTDFQNPGPGVGVQG